MTDCPNKAGDGKRIENQRLRIIYTFLLSQLMSLWNASLDVVDYGLQMIAETLLRIRMKKELKILNEITTMDLPNTRGVRIFFSYANILSS